VVNSPENGCLTNTVNVSFPGVTSTEITGMLDYYGIAVSAGSACSEKNDKPSRVLKALGLTDLAAGEAIRFSLGSGTAGRDIRYTVGVLRKYFEGKITFINQLSAADLEQSLLDDKKPFILDVRPKFIRRRVKSIPGSHEASFVSLKKHLDQIPEDQHIVVVCQQGNLSYGAAFYLKSKGYPKVSSLRSGIAGWKALNNSLK
jgi:rhodanese-related sulfurtransferase